METAALIIDNDLGFAFWLAKALDRAGYQAFPARSVPDAVALISDFQMSPRLMILGGTPAGADNFVACWRGSHTDVRVIRLLEDCDASGQPMPGIDVECMKPGERKEEDRAELLFLADHVMAHAAVAVRL